MSQDPEIIDSYDVMFAVRTGVTILVSKMRTLDGGIETPASFSRSPDNTGDVLIRAAGRQAVLKGLRKDYLEEAIERRMIMFYEMQDDEVVRCTPCSYNGP